jgi:hypothetical protein
MKSLLVVSALLLFAAPGCGDDTTGTTTDMPAAAGDMAKLNCGELVQCVSGCTMPDPEPCVMQCVANATTEAADKASALLSCLFGVCGPVDGGSGSCTSPSDVSAACQACQGAAVENQCMAQYSACVPPHPQ